MIVKRAGVGSESKEHSAKKQRGKREPSTVGRANANSVRFQAQHRRAWDRATAGWRRWYPMLEPQWQPVSDRLVALAQIDAGQQVLDVATGYGEPALTAARCIGATGRVIAIDQSAQMLALARERATDSRVKFRQMDAEALDLPLGSFDAALCRWGLMFLSDLATALAQIRRLLKPGGLVSAAVWDVPVNVPLETLGLELAQAMFGNAIVESRALPLFDLAAGALEVAMSKTGFVNVRSERVTISVAFESVESYCEYVRDVNVPLMSVLAKQTANDAAAFWQRLTAAVQPYHLSNGQIQMANTTICVVGQRYD
jgi:SAM-dependent methyltransferase